MKLRKIIFIFSIMLSAVLFANGIYVLAVLSGRHSIGNSLEFSQPPDTIHLESSISDEQPVNLLVLGLDNEKVRTDVILLFNYEPRQSKLNILSIARDTRVLDRGRFSKINALYSAGGEKLIAKETSRMTGLPVHYYLTMDFEGFRKIVDTLGGVEFYVPFRMRYDDPDQDLHINLYKGLQLLDGDAAEQLVRYRKGNRAGQGYIDGDIGRIRMQQDFVKSILNQKLNFKYLNRVDDIVGLMNKYMTTNIGLPDIAEYLGSLGKVDSGEVKTFTLPGDSVIKGGVWYFIHDEAGTKEMIRDYFYY
jgi:polyisoprenyl-teichoic acid--peptidoglycan teichoic acid transferase